LCLLLGSNSGNRMNYIHTAQSKIEQSYGAAIQASPVFETAAWGKSEQPDFLNQVIMVWCGDAPLDILQNIKNIETETGRTASEKWGQREIDIDILLYGDTVL